MQSMTATQVSTGVLVRFLPDGQLASRSGKHLLICPVTKLNAHSLGTFDQQLYSY